MGIDLVDPHHSVETGKMASLRKASFLFHIFK